MGKNLKNEIASIGEALKSKRSIIICDDMNNNPKLVDCETYLLLIDEMNERHEAMEKLRIAEEEKALKQFEELEKSLIAVADIVNVSKEDLNNMIKTLNDFGISIQEASNLIKIALQPITKREFTIESKGVVDIFSDDKYRGFKHRAKYIDLYPKKNIKGKSQWKKPVKIKCRNRLRG